MRNAWFFTLILAAASVHAQVDKWQLGGSGVAWDQQDSLEATGRQRQVATPSLKSTASEASD
jgi:hypothetical protein